eukprot:CAMPEP_0184738324 /NCGR_PEP_ID=MMETSP0315-20130426/1003_1 /TAXON_ID=101924 /ORGANISM="Rhodosorus marinus, Strain UTEX LB 2760" /LENGTH=549 /DNA_ID=CAMNT_0027205989 /DNA_START=781 /DNA_END=2430 /DNA_ORIENTATION=-
MWLANRAMLRHLRLVQGFTRGLSTSSTSSRTTSRVIGSLHLLKAFAMTSGAAAAAWYVSMHRTTTPAACEASISPGEFVKGLKEISLEEVQKHKSKSDGGIWVTYKGGVYDITEFIENHPGGESKILLAAGGPLEPFWSLYAQHQEEFVYSLLEEMRIGNLKASDKETLAQQDESDPYANDPARSPLLTVRSHKPFNAEPPLELLDSEITPNDLFYVRNHLPVPKVDAKDYKLEIVHRDGRSSALTLDDLKRKFKPHEVTATIMCAGNRRNEMNSIKTVKGGYWDAGAISTARWTGALLSEVLEELGITEEGVEHIQFEGLDKDSTTQTIYGASIPADIAMDKKNEVLLAYKMNDEPIPADHGYPIRAVAPGIVGARNVKWVGKIIASDKESDSHWQQNDYKGFNSSVDWHNVDFSTAPAIQELPVISAICSARVEEDEVVVQGYAYSGGGRGIIRVDVTADNGSSWEIAELSPADPKQKRNRVYGWTLWSATLKLPECKKTLEDGCLVLRSRAVDSQYNLQPENCEKIWNLRGVLSNSWHKKKVVWDN